MILHQDVYELMKDLVVGTATRSSEETRTSEAGLVGSDWTAPQK